MKKLLAMLSIIALSACVNFTSSNTREIENNFPAEYNKKNVLVKTYIYPTINGVADPEKEIKLRMGLNYNLVYSFDKTGLFGDVSSNVKNPDITVEMVVKNNYTECRNCNYATYWTLFILPSWSNDRYHYQVRITDHRTGITSSHIYYEDALEVKQLFMVFGMPFAHDAKEEMHNRVFDRVVFEVSKI